MKSICYIIPYFGKLPKGFKMWLLSCRKNSTIDWILYTDDKTDYDYPQNVKVKYCSYDEIKNKIQSFYDFKINISKPWKLCDFRPAYGEIFKEDIKKYDFWGYCDMDLIFGDIRSFITDDILEKYEKIGFQGHSTLYKNTEEVNLRYRKSAKFKENFSDSEGRFFDEVGICELYEKLGIDYYKKTNFAHLDRFTNSFYLKYLPESEEYKNRRQIFTWEDGHIYRYYIDRNKNIGKDEFMYLHLFSRPISFKATVYDENRIYVIYPDIVKEIEKEKINFNFINKKGKCSMMKFFIKVAFFNRKKMTLRKIILNLKLKTNQAIYRSKSQNVKR